MDFLVNRAKSRFGFSWPHASSRPHALDLIIDLVARSPRIAFPGCLCIRFKELEHEAQNQPETHRHDGRLRDRR
ncbi:hypothetical protein BRPE64_DCDS02870 (plasmid) [Caballeronia insecticola]|uniref:Uncharacterized protein n=1 Tax=Caballeronia insecticola TaxID=758793 RepID=R4WRD9_9BURK|nr:hypothetical protein BRPE64_DCDS02870 [Caballeronia insecticola]